ASALGKSRSHIANALRLLDLPSSVRKLLDDNKLSAGHARAIAASPDVESLAARIAEQGLSVREAERLAQSDSRQGTPRATSSSSRSTPAAPSGALSADAQALRKRLEQALGLKVELTTKPNSEASAVTLHCSDYEQLDEVVRRLERPAGKG
ncbi:MAG: chromosome partitioning protein ParB, partial [Rhodospirillales bacterium]